MPETARQTKGLGGSCQTATRHRTSFCLCCGEKDNVTMRNRARCWKNEHIKQTNERKHLFSPSPGTDPCQEWAVGQSCSGWVWLGTQAWIGSHCRQSSARPCLKACWGWGGGPANNSAICSEAGVSIRNSQLLTPHQACVNSTIIKP